MIHRGATQTTRLSPYALAQHSAGGDEGTSTLHKSWSWAEPRPPERTSPYEEFEGEADAERLARQVQRELVRRTDPAERAAYYEEHGRLTEKDIVEGLTTRERARLNYVRWQLDRFEDAEIGDRLDHLEDLARLHREIALDIKAFADNAQEASRSRGRRSR